jgi:CRISPR-associated protein Csm2
MAYGPRNTAPGRGSPPGQRPPSGGGSGAPGPRASSGGRGGDDARRREIEEALRPPAQPPDYFAPNSTTVRPELVERAAEDIAKEFKTIPASQLRRFYAEVMALKRRIELTKVVTDDEVRAQMALLKAKAAYTCRRQKDYPVKLVAFFAGHAAAVRNTNDFRRGFQPHFEAVMAYHRVFEEKRGGGEE